MTSARKAFANRVNGRRNRGSRAAAARAAFRHGLSLPVALDTALAPQLDGLAREIMASAPGGPARHAHHGLACRIAEAMLDLCRVRLARRPLSATLDADPGDTATLRALARLDRYERRALSRRKFAIRALAAALGDFGRTTQLG